jgi:hypothetical protein
MGIFSEIRASIGCLFFQSPFRPLLDRQQYLP